MNILVIDGQGGQLGSAIIKSIKPRFPEVYISAVGSNATASAAMLKAGAHQAATGENPVLVACRKADVIIGPVGIVIADALFGEISPKMSVAIAQADAVRILLPVNKCDNLIAGVPVLSVSVLVEDCMKKLDAIINGTCNPRETMLK